ncbi:MAG: PIN domain-containing protein [Chloroflexi bacterium]|nr:PIN domain-containing protein [Chloroflexota bacterium]
MRIRNPLYTPDETDAVSAADLQITLRKRGRQLATIDALIATLALRHNLILLTTDRDFQAAPELAQENWMSP